MRGTCLFTNTLLSLKTYWLCGVTCLAPAAGKAPPQMGTERILTEWRQLLCFLLLFFHFGLDMEIPQAGGQSVFWPFLELPLRLIDNAPISTYGCRGQEHATLICSSSCVYAADDKWERTHISPLRTWRSFLSGNGFTSVPSSPSIRPRTESIVF